MPKAFFADYPGRALGAGFLAGLVLVVPGPPIGAAAVAAGSPPVVINEIMYHPPDDRDDLQWLELFNPTGETVDLSGWKFTKGLQFTFPAGTRLPAGGHVVVARSAARFNALHPESPALGEFTGRLSHGGENIELSDAAGNRVDHVKFDDADPWPIAPDGFGASLERISAATPGNLAANWAPSPPGGTPARANATLSSNLPPVITEVRLEQPLPTPGQPVAAIGTVADPDGIREVRLQYQLVNLKSSGPQRAGAWQEVPCARTGGDEKNGTYAGSIPGVVDGTLLRYRFVAIDTANARRIHPHPADARPSFSAYVGSNPNTAQIPFARLYEISGAEQTPPPPRGNRPPPPKRQSRRGSAEAPAVQGNAAFLWIPPKGETPLIFDHVSIGPRKGGWKVRLHRDQLLDGMSTVNIIFEGEPRYVLSEHLAYELYRDAGVLTPQSGHWRVWYNGRPVGYHLFVEQPNSTFLRRSGRHPDGDLFKLLWYGQGIVGQHEKKNNPDTGHIELSALIQALKNTSGTAQWEIIQKHFNVPEMVNYFAVNMCIQNWDGFFNNYFIYKTPGATGTWEIIPWDEDKTWGDYDGASREYDWYTMPLTMGMSGNQPGRGLRSIISAGPFGGTSWWRPPGWFSGPLLANPEFRSRFRKRLQEICQTVFTLEHMEIPITRVERRLEPEVLFRAQALGYAPATALAEFRNHIGSFRRQVEKRREFILVELAKRE